MKKQTNQGIKARRSWSDYGEISIVTRVVKSKKQYDRAQSKARLARELSKVAPEM
jgi:hypothetical protein